MKSRSRPAAPAGKLPQVAGKITGKAAVAKTMQEMVDAAKRGEGTLIFKPHAAGHPAAGSRRPQR
jgi:hypothetical protein